MSVNNKGGRGKKLPYESEMVRTPVPVKELVQQIVEAYRMYYDTPYFEEYLKTLQEGIYKANTVGFDTLDVNDCLVEIAELKNRLNAIMETLETFRKQAKNTRDWTQAKRLINELSSK